MTTQKVRKKKHWQHGLNYYLGRYGGLIEVWKNPCGCHPFDVSVTHWDRNMKRLEKYSYSFRSHQKITAFCKARGWERLK